ncbi:magnesium transporter CorA family protein [Enterococcus saccharolyticus]|uniref:Magnesium transporter n=1 Tax=Candidatus Enterococcus willemsii TaxID=1857215 RepID=A0ABQ6Z1D0_9ENTE|nr:MULTISPECIES: magnesium transporter CorA family protein [Enterococcus]KAF1305232.1 magnesium transporter [Enterococcus sp. CU12B]MCD5000887.1 magnesium transporter CorA family protein [Enterococcus saccharolyticus]
MMMYFQLDKEHGLKPSTTENYNWLVIDEESKDELPNIITQFHLPKDIFVAADSLDEISRMEYLEDTTLTHAISLVFFNLSSVNSSIEERISPISFILSEELLIIYVGKNRHFMEQLFEKQVPFHSFEQIILYALLNMNRHFIAGLKEIKQIIDKLDRAARKTTGSKELFQLADVEREIIFIAHVLADQNQTLDYLCKDHEFLERVNDQRLVFDVKLRQKQALKTVQIYQDLLKTIGDLFASMISNNLNQLMKYLESAALVLTIPTVIGGIWGMNTGGLPGKESPLGFFIVMVGMFILTVLTGVYLAKKNYFK